MEPVQPDTQAANTGASDRPKRLAALANAVKQFLASWPTAPKLPAMPPRKLAGAAPAPLPTLDMLGSQYPDYAALFKHPSPWLNAEHQAIARLPVDGAVIRSDVQGFLRPADALLLYELAHCGQGDVLELGSAWGLSTRILGQAIRSAGRRARVASIEIDPGFQLATQQTMQAAGLHTIYESLKGAAEDQLPPLVAGERRFGMAFIDHDHSHAATQVACNALNTLLTPGGFAVFHDFNDARNREEPDVYGVFLGVREWLARRPDFAFVGMVGCCGLVQRRAA